MSPKSPTVDKETDSTDPKFAEQQTMSPLPPLSRELPLDSSSFKSPDPRPSAPLSPPRHTPLSPAVSPPKRDLIVEMSSGGNTRTTATAATAVTVTVPSNGANMCQVQPQESVTKGEPTSCQLPSCNISDIEPRNREDLSASSRLVASN